MPAVHPKVLQALEQKPGSPGADVTPWLRAWHPLQTFCAATPVDDQLLLIRECRSPDDLLALATILRATRPPSSWLHDQLAAVEETATPLPLWIHGLTLLIKWMSANRPQQKPSLTNLNGFLSCCAEYQRSQTQKLNFIATVHQLLHDHGIEE